MEPLRLSIIVEWDNVRLSEMKRCQAMLEQLALQTHELRSIADQDSGDPTVNFLVRFTEPVEAIVLYNSQEVDGTAVEKIIRQTIAVDNPDIDLQIVAADGADYYQLKNIGAQHASGDYLVFVDSDVIPEDDWLVTLLGSFTDQKVSVVGGNSYIDPYDIWAKTFALTWFFPLRSRDGAVHPTDRFFANNVAFRKATFAKFPFPVVEGTARGACTKLARALDSHHVTLYQNPCARVSHPPPNGLRLFFVRAFAEGRDHVLLGLDCGKRFRVTNSMAGFSYLVCRSWGRVLTLHRRVGLSVLAVPFAASVATMYYLLRFFGELLTHLSPKGMAQRFEL